MRRLCFIALLLISFSANAKTVPSTDYFNTETYWRKLQLQTDGIKPYTKAGDTCIVVVSNRAPQQGQLRFMGETCDGMLHYFFVKVQQGKWLVYPMTDLQKALSYMPLKNNDWLVYTEGMGKLFTSDLDRGINVAAQYKVNVILLDYPSITSTKGQLGNYTFAIQHAKAAYKDFLPVLEHIKAMKDNGQIAAHSHLSLFFHSMGNNVISEIVLNHKLNKLNDEVWVDNLILNAPCVPERDHTKWLNQIAFAKHIYVHYNPDDHTLKGAHLVSFHRQLGERVCWPVSNKATYINFSVLAGEGHSNFLTLYGRPPAKPAAIRHYNILFHGRTVDVNDMRYYYPSHYQDIGYTIVP